MLMSSLSELDIPINQDEMEPMEESPCKEYNSAEAIRITSKSVTSPPYSINKEKDIYSHSSTKKLVDASPPSLASSSESNNTIINLTKVLSSSKNVINSNQVNNQFQVISSGKVFTPPTTAPSPTTISHEYNGIKIYAGYPHIATKIEAILEAPKFKKWLDDFNKEEIYFKEFTITDVDFFGPVLPSKLGFLKGYGLAYDKITGDAIPSVVFMRGNSIAVLIVIKIKESGKSYILLCKQLRFPAGRSLTEACAGMLDDQTKNVVGVVFNEVQQETGFLLTEVELIDLGSIRPSGGGCDEIIHLYAWEAEITQKEFEEKKSNSYGDGKQEKIQLEFYDYENFDDVLDQLGDVKAECCWRRYLRAKRQKV